MNKTHKTKASDFEVSKLSNNRNIRWYNDWFITGGPGAGRTCTMKISQHILKGSKSGNIYDFSDPNTE